MVIKSGALESINNEAWFLNQEIRVEPRLVVPMYAFCVHRDFFILIKEEVVWILQWSSRLQNSKIFN